jgi:transcriptional regulator with XRE-family HTH domain
MGSSVTDTDRLWTPDEILSWVERHGGNRSALARRLGIGRTHLQHLLSGRERPSRALIAHMATIDRHEG